MQRLRDNPDRDDTGPEEALEEPPVTTCKYSMFASAQSPKALAWMAALALATGHTEDAESWLVELIGAVLFENVDVVMGSDVATARQDTLRMS